MRPLAFIMRIDRVWYVCFGGRYGVGQTSDEAFAAVRGAS